MRGLFLAAIIVLLLAGGVPKRIAQGTGSSDGVQLVQSHTVREDFQHASLGQFASYPPAQDVGYEPSLLPTSGFDAPGGRALMRVIKPNRKGLLRFGFIRQTFLFANEGAKLSFSYRLNHLGSTDRIEVGLAGADGRRYVRYIQGRPNEWVKTDLTLADFRSLNGEALRIGVGIEGFYIIAALKAADPDISYRFLIDDITLTAARPARFDVHQPQTTSIDSQNAIVSASSFSAGNTLSIKVTAPVRLKEVTCSIESQDGKTVATRPLFDDATSGDDRRSDGIWSNSAVYVLQPSDPTGVWNMRLQGKTDDGRYLVTNVRFIHRKKEPTVHPRLYFGPEDKDELISRTRNPKTSAIWEKLVSDAAVRRGTGELAHGGSVFEMLDSQYLLPSLLGYFDVMNRARLRIEYNSLVGYIAKDVEARRSAKAALLDVARWSRWEPPWFTEHGQHTYYPAGQLAAAVACGYDLLFEDLTESERSLVRRALLEKSIIPVYREYVLDDRVLANTSNWIGHTVGGALIASSAIIGDVTQEESQGKFDVYLNGLLLKMERHIAASYLADGSYGEGISYKEFDLETTAPAFVALKRVLGIDYWERTYVRDSLRYSLYVLTKPVAASPDMGDSHPPSGRTLAPLVSQTKNATDRWFYEQFPHSSILDFLFFDESTRAIPPTLPTSRIFDRKGNAVFRTGWDTDAWVFLFRAGPNFNHNHADQGSFLLTAFGENLVSEAGWSDYYKDPYYATFFTQAAGHNTVLVDGDWESQSLPDTAQFPALDAYPRLSDAITSEFYDSVSADLTSVYSDLTRYQRKVVFIKPHYFVVFDDLEDQAAPAKFDWLLHMPDRSRITTGPAGLLVYSADKASLGVRILAPEDASINVRNGRLPYHTFATTTPKTTPAHPAILDLQTARPANATQFLVALAPARTSEEARGVASRMTTIKEGNLIGLRADRGTEQDVIVFRTDRDKQASRYADWRTDAAQWMVTRSGTRLTRFAAHSARSFIRQEGDLFISDSPASIAVDFNNKSIRAVVNAVGATSIRLFVGVNPVRVTLDGREVSTAYNRGDGMIALSIPAGQRDLIVTLP